MSKKPLVLAALALAVGACNEAERGERDPGVQSDTIIKEATLTGLWNGKACLEEDLAIGTIEGADEYVFGDVTEISSDGSGGVYVFDRQVPALRHYDRKGRFVRTLGAEGEGPGEYSGAILGLAVRRQGGLLALDGGNSRLTLYDPDGAPTAHWPLRLTNGLFMGHQLLTDSADQMYVKVLVEELREPRAWPWPIGLLHLDERGQVVDTIIPPVLFGEQRSTGGAMSTGKVWAFDPPVMVVGLNDEYVFEIRRPGGKVIKVIRQHEPVALSNDEWRAYEARREWEMNQEGRRRDLPHTPRTKPAYRAFQFGVDGRIWVLKYMPARYREVERSFNPAQAPPIPFTEQVTFDVFDSLGTYLGEIVVPERTELYWIGHEHVYGVRRGALDEQYVVRLQLMTSSCTMVYP